MNNKHKLNITITTEQYEELREIAYKSRKSIALILREMIDKYLNNGD